MNRTRYSRSSQLVWLLSLFVVLSMVIGTVLSVLPTPEPRATPTPSRPTLSATRVPATPTLAAPQVTPTP